MCCSTRKTFSAVAGSILLVVCVATAQTPLLSLLPSGEATKAWTLSDTARVYPGKDLYLFIDGGADLFLEYGFERALSAEYQNAGGATLNLEIYEMHDPAAAFGIYSIRSGDESTIAGLGQEAISRPYYTMFWKGNFYVSVAASDSTSSCKTTMMATAHAVDRAIAEKGKKPWLAEMLPTEDLRKIRYANGSLGFSVAHAFDIEGIFPAIDAVVGSYVDHTLVIIRYPGVDSARQQSAEIARNLSTDKRFKNLRREGQFTSVVDPAGRTVCVAQSGRYVVFGIATIDSLAIRSCRQATCSLMKQ